MALVHLPLDDLFRSPLPAITRLAHAIHPGFLALELQNPMLHRAPHL